MGTDSGEANQTELNEIARALNKRPRKALDFRGSEKAREDELAQLSKTVALVS